MAKRQLGTPEQCSHNCKQRVVFSLVLLWTLVVSIARTLRPPNDFAEAHWLIDYRFGLIKRGLVGSLLSLFEQVSGLEVTSRMLLLLSSSLLGLFCLLLAVVMYRVLQRLRFNDAALLGMAIFATSPFVVLSGHLLGYLDNILFMLAFAAAWLVLRRRYLGAALLAAAGVLTHESFLLIGLPLVWLACLLRTDLRWQQATALVRNPVLVLPTLAFGILLLSQSLLASSVVEVQLRERLRQFSFVQDGWAELVAAWMLRDWTTFLAEHAPKFLSRLTDPATLVILLSALVLLALLQRDAGFTSTPLLRSLGVVVPLAPLLLHLIAWDTPRISSYTIVVALGVVWLYAETLPASAAAPRLQPSFLLAALVVLLINCLWSVPLMDLAVERFRVETRMLLYAPLVLLAAMLVGRLHAQPRQEQTSTLEVP